MPAITITLIILVRAFHLARKCLKPSETEIKKLTNSAQLSASCGQI